MSLVPTRLTSLPLPTSLLRFHPELAALARDTELAFGRALQPFQLTPVGLERLTARLMGLLGEPPHGATSEREGRSVRSEGLGTDAGARGEGGGAAAGR